MRPSERSKFRRDHKSTTETSHAIIEKVRGKAAKRNMMGRLNQAPWVIVEKKLFERPSRDLLVLLLIDVYVSNLVNIAWFNTFVETNIEILHSPDPQDYCNKHYPVIVQYFNHFGVYFRNTLYPHGSAAKSFIHWLDLMMKPPFRGLFNGKSFQQLYYRIPKLATTAPSSTQRT